MTLIGPAPFRGRRREVEQVTKHLATGSWLSLHGEVGSGKTRLMRELVVELGPPYVWVACQEGDRVATVWSRVERALHREPDAVQRRRVIIDDVHHLHGDHVVELISHLARGPLRVGTVVLIGRESLAAAGAPVPEHVLHGLDVEGGKQLWTDLEQIHGPASGFASALARARGMPLALLREYACARFGPAAWDVAALAAPARSVIEALAVLRAPCEPGAVAALCPGIDVEAALTSLLAQQLIERGQADRLAVHETVRNDVLANMSVYDTKRLSTLAAMLIEVEGDDDGSVVPYSARIDGPLGTLDQLAYVRELVVHWVAADRVDLAADVILSHRDRAARTGGPALFEWLLDAVDGQRRDGAPSRRVFPRLDPERARDLTVLAAEIALRSGRFGQLYDWTAAAPTLLSRLLYAQLNLAVGDVRRARRTLKKLVVAGEPRALAALAELDLLTGNWVGAELVLKEVGDHLSQLDPVVRVRVRLAMAKLEEHLGLTAAMYEQLALAKEECKLTRGVDAEQLSAVVDARIAAGLAREGKLADALLVLELAEFAARDLAAVEVRDELSRARALWARRAGSYGWAARQLRDIAKARRESGDEMSALRATIELAELEVARGRPIVAFELATAALTHSTRCELFHFAARADVVLAEAELLRFRLREAQRRLLTLRRRPGLDAAARAHVEDLLAKANALASGAVSREASGPRDQLDLWLAAAELQFAAGGVVLALQLARGAAELAERTDRRGELAHALAIVARLELALGDRGSARITARRACREAERTELVGAHVHALLALCAIARGDGETSDAAAYASAAAGLAAADGLVLESFVANIVRNTQFDRPVVVDESTAAAAALSSIAVQQARRLLTDLGFTARPTYQAVGADGVRRGIALAHHEVLQFPDRSLVIDAVEGMVWRHGTPRCRIGHRRRLMRLAYLLASAPGKLLSKREIAEKLWGVDYYAARHDRKLREHIERLRWLIGDDQSQIVEVTSTGYRLMPPSDFLFVTCTEEEEH